MKIQQTITGTIIILLGILLIYFTYKETWIMITYGILIMILGIAILLNKREDIVEQIKWQKKK
ncbi:MAG: hypothetical protein OQK82_00975 [Candidatus Pacearchaeota archaeon]|nr:hypothetical protein [Candidatus Pacearchaeota archaeon]